MQTNFDLLKTKSALVQLFSKKWVKNHQYIPSLNVSDPQIFLSIT